MYVYMYVCMYVSLECKGPAVVTKFMWLLPCMKCICKRFHLTWPCAMRWMHLN